MDFRQEIEKLNERNSRFAKSILESNARNELLVEIIETLCIELKKDNTLPARRKQAKKQLERMNEILGR